MGNLSAAEVYQFLMSELTLKKLKSILSQKTLIPQSSALKIVQIKKRSSKLEKHKGLATLIP